MYEMMIDRKKKTLLKLMLFYFDIDTYLYTNSLPGVITVIATSWDVTKENAKKTR
jgi:hypothetical protein